MEVIKSETLRILPGSFEPENHWYPKAINATMHPMVNFFLDLDTSRIINRYCHMHPMVQPDVLQELLEFVPKYFLWAGADLINVTSAGAKRQMVVIENNSCPSGQKSMPLRNDNEELGGYEILMEQVFKKQLKGKRLPEGGLAVLYDKNKMEAHGYACAMADVFSEQVYLVDYYNGTEDQPVKFEDGVMSVRDNGKWVPIRAAFRYVTQKPWNRLPVNSKTYIFNPVVACLAGGRNKMVAAKAYDFFNAELEGTGLKINTPETVRDIGKNEIPLWVARMGGQAVIKIPYSNAGQGVYTIVNERELKDFMARDYEYDQFIVQSLIGNYNWSSSTSAGKLYHVGTVPDKKNKSYVCDLRMMVCGTSEGFKSLSVYARRAAMPLVDKPATGASSWDILGTNLSIKKGTNLWDSETSRLLLMDRRDFNKLGIGLDDLIEAYIQTVLSTIAIDKMATNLYSSKGTFKMKLFTSLNSDESLLEEIRLK